MHSLCISYSPDAMVKYHGQKQFKKKKGMSRDCNSRGNKCILAAKAGHSSRNQSWLIIHMHTGEEKKTGGRC